jgi:hypothetical protein
MVALLIQSNYDRFILQELVFFVLDSMKIKDV